MALILKDRVKETTVTTGTSSFALDGAVTGYQAFSAAIGDANTTYYAVYLDNSTEWEVGIGTYSSSGNTLARTTILASSNAGSIVTFSAGTKQIWCDYPAGKAVYANAAGNIDNASLTSPKINEILDTNGNEILGLSPTTSATDFLTVKNGIGVGVPLHVYADGSSTNVGLHIQPKGTGLVTISDGTDFNKGIRFRSSGSAASAVTLLDAVASAGRVVTLPDATTTLVGRDTTDTLTNKSISGSTNTLSNIGNSSLTNSAITINGTSTSLGGSISVGSVTSVSATVPSIFSVSGVPITGSGTIAMTYSGTALPIANGGTNSTATPTAGGAAYGTGTAYAVTAAGTTGQVLISNGASAPAYTANLVVASNIVDASANNGALNVPIGTSAQRPSSPATGATRYNTTLSVLEYYNGTNWYSVTAINNQSVTVSYLLVAGGGGGGYNYAGGGGAGGYLAGTTSLTFGTTYTVTVGAAGAGSSTTSGSNGGNSSLTGLTAVVGGGGGGTFRTSGASGGSGGGGGGDGNPATGGSATSGQGNVGGTSSGGGNQAGAGGGGAGAAGADTSGGTFTGGNGGVGLQSSITGSSTYYAGGGGGGANGTASAGSGGLGGGGAGGLALGGAGTAGGTNTGGGGGAGGANAGNGANGGSGVVIISVPTASYSGTTSGSPTVTTSGSNTIMTFTSSGSYTA